MGVRFTLSEAGAIALAFFIGKASVVKCLVQTLVQCLFNTLKLLKSLVGRKPTSFSD